MHALIVDTEVVELRPDDEVFSVVSGWYWVPVPEKIQGEINNIDWMYDRESDTFSKKPEYQASPEELRMHSYPPVKDQLDVLWHDIDEGRLPGKDTSAWYAEIKKIKDTVPKE